MYSEVHERVLLIVVSYDRWLLLIVGLYQQVRTFTGPREVRERAGRHRAFPVKRELRI